MTEEAGQAAVKHRGQEAPQLNISAAKPRPLDPSLQEPEVTLGEYRGETGWPAADRSWA